jgi:metallo-beta-lactamase family protein
MRITLHGAAGGVTGSAYLIETTDARVLVDCGMFQGSKKDEAKNVIPPELKPDRLDAVVLTHAHLDHTGRLPLLVKSGFKGPIYANEATQKLTDLILRDAAKVQAYDTERTNRKRERNGQEPIEPLFTSADVESTLERLRTVWYDKLFEPARGMSVQAVDAGHMLGSSSIAVTVTEGLKKKVIVFSGDIGPHKVPILRDPVSFTHADLVFLESTYGDRDHRAMKDTLIELRDIIREAVVGGGKMLVPAFAVGRTQQILYHLTVLFDRHEIPTFPVFVDGPMSIEATRIYASHPELYDEEAAELARDGLLTEKLPGVTVCETPEESKALNSHVGPCMIIAGAGMCNAGRIVHHLRHNLGRTGTHVVIVGYQAEGTMGRQLVDGARQLQIFGDSIDVRAKIHTLNGFSAHAGQSDLLKWYERLSGSKPPVVLTHGEDRGRNGLRDALKKRFGVDSRLPLQGDTIEI